MIYLRFLLISALTLSISLPANCMEPLDKEVNPPSKVRRCLFWGADKIAKRIESFSDILPETFWSLVLLSRIGVETEEFFIPKEAEKEDPPQSVQVQERAAPQEEPRQAPVRIIDDKGKREVDDEPPAKLTTVISEYDPQRERFLALTIAQLHKHFSMFQLIAGEQPSAAYKEPSPDCICDDATKQMFLSQFNLYDPTVEAEFIRTYGTYAEQEEKHKYREFMWEPTLIGAINEAYLALQKCILEANPDTTTELFEETVIKEISKKSFIKMLPAEIGRLKNLVCLSLPHPSRLFVLPPQLFTLEKLEELDLGSNKLHILSPDIAKLRRLRNLNLSLNGLTSIPDSLWSLTSLEKLDLSHNKFGELSDKVSQLKKLRVLHTSCCDITKLPPCVWDMTTLVDLSLCNCNLITVSPNIKQLVNLERLSLGWNNLTTLPAEMKDLTNLRDLDLWNNQLEILPKVLWQLPQLRVLRVSSNPLKTLPDDISKLSLLEKLDLEKTQLILFPPTLTRLDQLEELRLSDNEISCLPPEIGNFKKIRSLWLGGNLLTQIPSEIGKLSDLLALNLQRNKLESLPREMTQLKGLKLLWVEEQKSEGKASLSFVSSVKDLQSELKDCKIDH